MKYPSEESQILSCGNLQFRIDGKLIPALQSVKIEADIRKNNFVTITGKRLKIKIDKTTNKKRIDSTKSGKVIIEKLEKYYETLVIKNIEVEGNKVIFNLISLLKNGE